MIDFFRKEQKLSRIFQNHDFWLFRHIKSLRIFGSNEIKPRNMKNLKKNYILKLVKSEGVFEGRIFYHERLLLFSRTRYCRNCFFFILDTSTSGIYQILSSRKPKINQISEILAKNRLNRSVCQCLLTSKSRKTVRLLLCKWLLKWTCRTTKATEIGQKLIHLATGSQT